MVEIIYFTTTSGRSPVQDFILKQQAKAQAKIYEVVEYLQEFGFHLPAPYLRRMIGSNYLWELRTQAQSKQYRIFLAKGGDNIIVLLHAIVKKTQKTPPIDIETAQNRLKVYKKG